MIPLSKESSSDITIWQDLILIFILLLLIHKELHLLRLIYAKKRQFFFRHITTANDQNL